MQTGAAGVGGLRIIESVAGLIVPRRELSRPSQVIAWLEDWGKCLEDPAEMILIGSRALLWHVHLMPEMVLRSLPEGWEGRSERAGYGNLSVCVPAVDDLLHAKLQRREPRDLAHLAYMRAVNLTEIEG